MEETRKFGAIWDAFVAHTPGEAEEFVAFELVNRLIVTRCGALTSELGEWLTPSIGRQAAEVRLSGDLYNLIVQVTDTAVAVGIAVEKCRALAESGKPGESPDYERWLQLALAWSRLAPVEVKSLIPTEPSKPAAD